jgi:hypothetical protein
VFLKSGFVNDLLEPTSLSWTEKKIVQDEFKLFLNKKRSYLSLMVCKWVVCHRLRKKWT